MSRSAGAVGRVTTSLEHFLGAAGAWSVAGSLLVLPLPFVLGLAPPAYLATATLIGVLAALVVIAEPRASRRLVWSVFALAFLCRMVVLVILAMVQLRHEGGLVLGPDGIVHFQKSLQLAVRGWSWPVANVVVWGTWDVGHLYLFAALIRGLGADLFALQVFNCGLSALNAALTLSAVRLVRPQYAAAVALLVALYPASITLASFDLMKDASVSFASLAAVWGLLRAWYGASGCSRAAFALLASLALAYLRCTRSYVVVYLEVAMVTLLPLAFVRRLPVWRARSRLAVLAITLLVVEAGTWSLGWPLSPQLMVNQIRYTLRTPAMLQYAPGLVERAQDRSGPTSTPANQAGASPAPTPFRLPTAGSSTPSAASGTNIVYVPSPAEARSGREPARGPVATVANIFRRLYGPFIWIRPPSWDARVLLRGDYMAYPGMALWYAALPFMIVGLATVIAAVVTGRETNLPLAALAVFVTCYFAQYLAINLSYRQREVMFPFLAIFACAGWSSVVRFSRWRLAYGVYWIALAVVATVHLIARALLARG